MTLQVNSTHGQIRFGLLTDTGEDLARRRAAYVPWLDTLALNLGLKALFASSEGDLLGRHGMSRLQKIGTRLTKLARRRQPIGLKARSHCYPRYVQQLRGYHVLVSRYVQRFNRLKAKLDDPRATNSYFRDWLLWVTSTANPSERTDTRSTGFAG